jgi:hypothetical protein
MPMLPVSAAELLSIQQDAQAAVCDKVCLIYRHTTNTADGYGSSTPSYTLINTTVCGMRQPTAGELANFAFEIEDKVAWTVLLPYGTDVRAQDHLVVEGNTIEAHVPLEPHSYPALLAVVGAELKP